jgi:hypothetical protein
MRRITTASVVSLLLVVLAVTGSSVGPAGAQAASPTVVVTPSTGLVDGQVVGISAAGFPPSTTVVVRMCPPGAVGPFDCSAGDFATGQTDAQGTFTGTHRVRRLVPAVDGASLVDCATATCSVMVGRLGAAVAQAPVSFAASAPSLSVGPVVDGRATVEGVGWPWSSGVLLSLCPSATAPDAQCTNRDGALGWPGTTFSTVVDVDPELVVVEAGEARAVDCRTVTCTVRAHDGYGHTADAPLDLTSVPPHPSQLVVEPSTGLADLSVVDVVGDGFGAGEVVTVRQCLPKPDAARVCAEDSGASPLLVTSADEHGEVSGSVVVRRDLADVVTPTEQPTWVDCASTSCFLLVDVRAEGGTLLRRVVVPLDLLGGSRPAIDPQIAAEPTAQPEVYTVTGTGFPLGGEFGLWVCGGAACEPLAVVAPDSQGVFSAAVEIPSPPGSSVDCLVEQCVLTVRRVGSDLDVVLAPLTEPPLDLGVAIETLGVLDATTGEAVARAVVTCGRPVTLDVEGEVAQPGAVGGFAFQGQPCAPGAPLHAFIPTRTLTVDDVPFALGPAEVTVTVTRAGGGSATTVSGTTTLLDQGTVATALLQAMADPGATALRELFVSATLARLRQDPVFAAAWQAAFGG